MDVTGYAPWRPRFPALHIGPTDFAACFQVFLDPGLRAAVWHAYCFYISCDRARFSGWSTGNHNRLRRIVWRGRTYQVEKVNMRKYLLMGAALGLLAAAPAALAGGDQDGGGLFHHNKTTFDVYVAYASANNWAQSGGNRAWSGYQNTSANITNSGQSVTGVLDQAQNAGANSVLQNALSLAYVNNPNAGYSSQTLGAGFAMAGAQNGAFVMGNTAETGFDYCPINTVTQAATIYNSYNGGTGTEQINQNVGDNSVLQNATAIADVTQATGTKGTLGVSFAAGGNNGGVFGNGGAEKAVETGFSGVTHHKGTVLSSRHGESGT